MIPHDLLPIIRPLEDRTPIRPTQFYEDVIQHLIPDIIRIEANGIPIDLKQVRLLETELDNTLQIVKTKLADNPIIQEYLTQVSLKQVQGKKEKLETKKKSSTDFLKEFNLHNKIHLAYVVNLHLDEIGHSDKKMLEWKRSDLKKLNTIIASKFIDNLIHNDIQSWMITTIDKAMLKLARDKAEIYNKNMVDSKIDKLSNLPKLQFNPGSSQQKQELFAMCGIESERETTTGNPQWNRQELERLQNLLAIMLDERTGENNLEGGIN